MSKLRNSVRLIGNLGHNPDVNETSNGKKVARFSIATSETFRNDTGERVTETQWHTVIAWGKQAEIAEKYLYKGSEVAVEGKLSSRSYNDTEGVKRFTTEIICREILLLGKRDSKARQV